MIERALVNEAVRVLRHTVLPTDTRGIDAVELLARAVDEARDALWQIRMRIEKEEKKPHNDFGDVGQCIDDVMNLAGEP